MRSTQKNQDQGQVQEATQAPAPRKPVAPARADAMKAAAERGASQQKQVFDFTSQRLDIIAEVQRRESAKTSHHSRRTWWDEVADTHKQRKGLTKPEPARWHQPANLYLAAARAAAAGDLVRASRTARAAIEAEQAAWQSLTRLVNADDLKRPTEPGWARSVSADPVEAVQVPGRLQATAHGILAEHRWVPDSPVRMERAAAGPEEVVEEEPKVEDKAAAKPEGEAEAPQRRPRAPKRAPQV